MARLKQKVITGAAWTIGMRAIVNLLGTVSILILARLLTPSDFGVVALAASAYYFFDVIGQLGFDAALIHIKNPEREHYDAAWTANIVLGVFVCFAMIAVAGPVGKFFGDVRVENIVYALSALGLIKGFENIAIVNFRKQLEFRGDFFYIVFPKFASFLGNILAAYILQSYWALVIGMFAAQIVSLIYSYKSQAFRPRLAVSKIPELFEYSRWIVAANLLWFTSNTGVQVILGRLMGAPAVGIFGVARRLAQLPTSELVGPINRVLFPSLSSIKDDAPRIRSVTRQVLGVTAFISIPAAAGIFALADQIVETLFNDKWIELGPVLKILAFVGVLQAIQAICDPILLARGKPGVQTFVQLISLVIGVPLAIWMTREHGVIGLAWSVLITMCITAPVLIIISAKDIQLKLSEIFFEIWRPLISSVVMVGGLLAVVPMMSSVSFRNVFLLAISILIGVVFYFFTCFFLWWISGKPTGSEARVFELIKGRLSFLAN